MKLLEWLFGEGGVERTVNSYVWGVPAMALILGVGVWLTVLCGAPQFLRFRLMLRNTLGGLGKKGSTQAGTVSPGKALWTALAASIGTGNIAGVSGAIAVGGPGAVFWMWVSALAGMCTKFAEVTLAVRYRERNERGDWVGGPMYYIKNGLGRGWRWLAVLFCVFGSLAAFGIGNMVQVNTIAAAVNQAVAGFLPVTEGQQRGISLVVGLLCAALVLAVLVGGIRRIGDVCALLVPGMAVLYTLAALAVITVHLWQVPAALEAIFVGAFRPAAVAGGLAGTSIRTAVTRGVGRGIFSNEAGLGSAPIAHAAADTDHPAAQGLYGVLEVFLDTVVGCTLTALVVLLGVGVEGIPYGEEAGAALSVAGFRSVFGGRLAAVIVAVCLILFALPTILTWGLYGARCFEFLFGTKACWGYQLAFAGVVVVGATMQLDLVWQIADTLNGLMALPNLVALVILSPEAARLSRDYFQRCR